MFCRNGFTNHFQFRITPVPGQLQADGLAFIIQGQGTNLVAGEYGPGAAIKFDTYQNPGDLGTNYVAVLGDTIPYLPEDLTPLQVMIANGAAHDVFMIH